MTRIVLITAQVAPFQVELAAAINALPHIDYHVVFTAKENKRPSHWLSLNDKISRFSTRIPANVSGQSQLLSWGVDTVTALKPDIVLIGGVRNINFDIGQALKQKTSNRPHIGLWMEPPLTKRNFLHGTLRQLDYHRRLRQVDFVLAIGDRAHAYYRKCNRNTHFVPYGSDLGACLGIDLPKPRGDTVKFLFSGGLAKRHNFPMIMEGFKRLFIERGPCFEFIISGNGPEQTIIDAAVQDMPELGPLIRYEREFTNWTDRLNPFLEAHVLIYPTQHAGWGLVVPEAMAAGATVIGSQGAESARYLVTNNVNGFIIKPDINDFITTLIKCVDDRDMVEKMGINARQSARKCHAPQVAQQLVNTLKIAANSTHKPTKKFRL